MAKAKATVKKEKVEVANKTGIRELDAMLAAVSKKFGKDLGGENYGDVEIFTTGSLNFDIALKRGGIPTNTVIEIYGPNSSFKTTFAVIALAARQKWRKEQGITDQRDLIIDLEYSMEESYLVSYGVDMDMVIWVRPDTIEEALQMCIDIPKSGKIDYVIFDSVDAGQNERQQRRQVGEADVGGSSKDMNFALRTLSKLCHEYKTTYWFINQIKMNPGVMFGSPETTPGGLALGFYASLRLKMLTRAKVPDLPGASMIRCKVGKTKLSGDVEDLVTAAIIWGQGYDETYELNALATKYGILRHSAGQTKVAWTKEHELEPIDSEVEPGKQAGIDYIRTNDGPRFRLRHAVLRATETGGAMSDEAALAFIKEKYGDGREDSPTDGVSEEDTESTDDAEDSE
jgi:recombination protein RecA